jgi:putative SOS response-associated peptidase YedK
MCGRFTLRTPRQALVDLFADIAAPGTLDSVSPRYNIAGRRDGLMDHDALGADPILVR